MMYCDGDYIPYSLRVPLLLSFWRGIVDSHNFISPGDRKCRAEPSESSLRTSISRHLLPSSPILSLPHVCSEPQCLSSLLHHYIATELPLRDTSCPFHIASPTFLQFFCWWAILEPRCNVFSRKCTVSLCPFPIQLMRFFAYGIDELWIIKSSCCMRP